ncbi:vanadium-dependent haloperoxidase [Chryseolinea lacunae]|uniref:Vanadium-dependent haloperoxidase n=1 Tax=Chryseolinea lacunae TaxID=2801331 RepID=A0ABS1KMI2_9BACT|nr:vanadium-dependent haloperoxidase [Chryseolinea lacunae]MBL0740664.1 vanadium-dependent haloperoxidase [Chryseolinea lacunae]
MIKKIVTAAVFTLLMCCKPAGDFKSKIEDPEHLHQTIKKVTDIIVHDIFSPPVASRIYAYVSVATYEAARHQDSTLLSLEGQLHGLADVPQPEKGKVYCFPLASVQAALKMARVLIFSEDELDKYSQQLLAEYQHSGMPEDVYQRSVEFGTAVAEHVAKWSTKDNYKQSRSFPKYSIDQKDSTWKPTPPAYMDAVEPHWRKIRTFVIDSASQFRPASPPPFSTDKRSHFYALALQVYDVGKSLTPEQQEIARFWDCNPFVMNVKGHVMFATKKISPGGHWMNIVRVACRTSNANAARAAEAYVRVALSLADGFIACWDEKYRSQLVRPETFINQHIDENWVPLLQTPPFPEYISGHSVISGAAAQALTGVFGDNFQFTDSTETEFGLTARRFKSFAAAADEAAISRLYGGIHYLPACDTGLVMGRNLGVYITNTLRTRESNLSLNQQP